MLSKVTIFYCLIAFAHTEPKQVVRIAGGKNAELGQYPYYVSLYLKNMLDEYEISFCGGAILNNQWIITAAYCISLVNDDSDIKVKAGSINYRQYTETEQISAVVQRIIHSNYSISTGPFDIGLMKLETPLIFNNFVNRINLPEPGSIPTGLGTIAGLGYLQDIREPNIPEYLQAVTLPVIHNDKCLELIYNLLGDDAAELNLLDELRFCTGPTEKNQGYCLHDTGDPLVIKENKRDILVGVATFGFAADCQTPGAPSIYTRISAFNNWIEENVNMSRTHNRLN